MVLKLVPHSGIGIGDWKREWKSNMMVLWNWEGIVAE